jgi:lipopolysaccharide transport system ATP-binding protein
MADFAIRCESLSKRYRIGDAVRYRTLRESLMNAMTFPGRRSPRIIWALDDVTFDVKQGEVLGIIGRNGAGKSTLLKILSRITRPTRGRAVIRGRIGSLLEVGTGFHSELTGRENIFLSGAVMGMKRRDITARFDEIVGFAEVGAFLDTPVKRYSTGMYMRLAFAVAAHLEPDILLIDEVLAVGDAAFQKKCLGRVSDVAKSGRTALFVSHNMVAVQGLCASALRLERGRIVQRGDSHAVIHDYLRSASTELSSRVWSDEGTAPGNDLVRIHRAAVHSARGGDGHSITVRTPIQLEFDFWSLQPGRRLSISIHVFNESGTMVFDSGSAGDAPLTPGLYRATCHIPGDFFNDGTHSVKLNVIEDESRLVYSCEDILAFNVLDSSELRGPWFGQWGGAVRPNLRWTTERVEESSARIAK